MLKLLIFANLIALLASAEGVQQGGSTELSDQSTTKVTGKTSNLLQKSEEVGGSTVTTDPTKQTCEQGLVRLQAQSVSLDHEKLMRESTSSKQAWLDQSFKFPEAIVWENLPQVKELSIASHVQNLGWKRLSQLSKFQSLSMWGHESASFNDVEQGGLDDSWLAAVASAVALDPSRLKSIFKVQETNTAGVYAFQMYNLGTPVTVTIDDYLPIERRSGQKLKYGGESNDQGVWFPLLEKATAKFLGNYQAISGGNDQSAYSILLGAPSQRYTLAEHSSDEVWLLVTGALEENSMVTVRSFGGTESAQNVNAEGIPNAQFFTILSTKINAEGARLVQIRNPRNEENYSGQYSDKQNDGEYFMGIEDFVVNYEAMTVARDVRGMKRANYLFKADDEDLDQAQILEKSTQLYNTHRFTITSPVEQKVILSLYTYDQLQYVSTCNETYFESRVYVRSSASAIPFEEKARNPGAVHLPELAMSVGEAISIEVYTRFTDGDLLPHDWQLVVLADKEAVQISKEVSEKETRMGRIIISTNASFALIAMITCFTKLYCDHKKEKIRQEDDGYHRAS